MTSVQQPSLADALSLDSLPALQAFVQRCRNEESNHARATLAKKLSMMFDSQLRASFIELGGLDILYSWLDPSSSPTAVLRQTLEALAQLPLSRSQVEHHQALLARLQSLRDHVDETVSQLADDCCSNYERKLVSASSSSASTTSAENVSSDTEFTSSLKDSALDADGAIQTQQQDRDEEEEDEEESTRVASMMHSKFRLIKIDKESSSLHHSSASAPSAASAVHGVTMVEAIDAEAAASLLESSVAPAVDSAASVAADEAEIDVTPPDSDSGASDAITASSPRERLSDSSLLPSKRARKSLSVSWKADSELTSVLLFKKDDPIVQAPSKKTSTKAEVSSSASTSSSPSSASSADRKRTHEMMSRDEQFPSMNQAPLKPTIEWRVPAIVELEPSLLSILHARGKESREREKQKEREKRTLRSFYLPHDLPQNPNEIDDASSMDAEDAPEMIEIAFDMAPMKPPPSTLTSSSASSLANMPSSTLMSQLNALNAFFSTNAAQTSSTSAPPSSSKSVNLSSPLNPSAGRLDAGEKRVNPGLASIEALLSNIKPAVASSSSLPFAAPVQSPNAASSPLFNSSLLPAATTPSAFPSTNAAPAATKDLLSLLSSGSGTSALGSIAAALSARNKPIAAPNQNSFVSPQPPPATPHAQPAAPRNRWDAPAAVSPAVLQQQAQPQPQFGAPFNKGSPLNRNQALPHATAPTPFSNANSLAPTAAAGYRAAPAPSYSAPQQFAAQPFASPPLSSAPGAFAHQLQPTSHQPINKYNANSYAAPVVPSSSPATYAPSPLPHAAYTPNAAPPPSQYTTAYAQYPPAGAHAPMNAAPYTQSVNQAMYQPAMPRQPQQQYSGYPQHQQPQMQHQQQHQQQQPYQAQPPAQPQQNQTPSYPGLSQAPPASYMPPQPQQTFHPNGYIAQTPQPAAVIHSGYKRRFGT